MKRAFHETPRTWMGMVPTLAAASVLLLTGCRTPTEDAGRAFYPIGIYTTGPAEDFTAIGEAGFNLVTGPAHGDLLDAAQARGLRVLATPETMGGGDFDAARAGHSVRQWDSHPALWAWYLVDEPDFNLIPPGQVKRAADAVKKAGGRKPRAAVFYQGTQVRHYAEWVDVVMIDRYPVPWLPLANFGQHVQLARASIPRSKPLIAVVQAFDWSCHPGILTGESNLRPPSHAEIRCMTYDALARGANGLFFYAYDDGAWRMRDHPQTWEALKRVVAEVHERLPLFQAQRPWWPRVHNFGDRNRRFNAALDSSITSCLLRVTKGNTTIPPGDYILAVNTTENAQRYGFSLPPGESGGPGKPSETRAPGTVRVVGESRWVNSANGWLQDEFQPYEVHAYGPLESGRKPQVRP